MWKRVQVALAILLVASSGVAMWQFLRLREPSYQGKPLSTWLADFDLESAHSPEKAKQAVRTIGTNSFPFLMRMLGTRDPLWTKAIIALDDRQSVIQFHITRANVIRYRAAQGYSALGAAAKQEVAPLIQLMDSEPSADLIERITLDPRGNGKGTWDFEVHLKGAPEPVTVIANAQPEGWCFRSLRPASIELVPA